MTTDQPREDAIAALREVLANGIEALDSWEGCGDVGCNWGESVSLPEVLALVRGAAALTPAPPAPLDVERLARALMCDDPLSSADVMDWGDVWGLTTADAIAAELARLTEAERRLAALPAEPAASERPVERPVIADRCVCSHLWTDHTTWCDSSGCPCRFTTNNSYTLDASEAQHVERLDVERLARALQTDTVRRYVAEAWVDGGVSEPGYATADEMAAVIAREYAALRGEP